MNGVLRRHQYTYRPTGFVRLLPVAAAVLHVRRPAPFRRSAPQSGFLNEMSPGSFWAYIHVRWNYKRISLFFLTSCAVSVNVLFVHRVPVAYVHASTVILVRPVMLSKSAWRHFNQVWHDGLLTSAVGRFLLPDQLSGTRCPMTYVMLNVLQTFSDSR